MGDIEKQWLSAKFRKKRVLFSYTTPMKKGNNVISWKKEKTQLQEQGLAETVALCN